LRVQKASCTHVLSTWLHLLSWQVAVFQGLLAVGLLAVGGDDFFFFFYCRFSPGYVDGRRGIRLYQRPPPGTTPNTWRDGAWRDPGTRLRSPRWYPTQVR
jgi:hypothetical protein